MFRSLFTLISFYQVFYCAYISTALVDKFNQRYFLPSFVENNFNRAKRTNNELSTLKYLPFSRAVIASPNGFLIVKVIIFQWADTLLDDWKWQARGDWDPGPPASGVSQTISEDQSTALSSTWQSLFRKRYQGRLLYVSPTALALYNSCWLHNYTVQRLQSPEKLLMAIHYRYYYTSTLFDRFNGANFLPWDTCTDCKSLTTSQGYNYIASCFQKAVGLRRITCCWCVHIRMSGSSQDLNCDQIHTCV